MHTYRWTLLALFLLVGQPVANAVPVKYDISWTGANGYSLTGNFDIDSSLLGTGAITSASLLDFFIEGFHTSTLLGTFSGTPTNFNFDTNSETLLIGGSSCTSTGQAWNVVCPVPAPTTGIGFRSGDPQQGLFLNGFAIVASFIDTTASTLQVRRAPEPATLALLGIGLAGLGFSRRRRQ